MNFIIYMCTMSDEAIIVKNLGKVFLGGPPLVKAATGEIVSELDLGGAELHTEMSGCTDHYADSEVEAFRIAREIAETLPDRDLPWVGHTQSRYTPSYTSTISKPPLYDGIELLSIATRTDTDRERINMHEAIARFVDESKLHEHRPNYGKTLICGWARIEGILVGIIANNGPLVEGTHSKFSAKDMENVGASACPPALKGAHFIRLCEQKQTPLVYLIDTDDSADVTYHGKDIGVMKDIGKMMQAGNTTSLPKITLVMGRNTGPSSFAMSPRSSSPKILLSWTHARSGVQGSDFDAWFGTSRVWDDGVIG